MDNFETDNKADTNKQLKIIPGEFRQHDASVGRHVAISPGALPRFMNRFDSAYVQPGSGNSLISPATAHHQLLWMPPFLDGKEPLSRLMFHVMLRNALDVGGMWSIARGLAQNEATYQSHLANYDLPRRNDLDGRGNLSEEPMAVFARYFIVTRINQIDCKAELIQPNELRARVMSWADDEIRNNTLRPNPGKVL